MAILETQGQVSHFNISLSQLRPSSPLAPCAWIFPVRLTRHLAGKPVANWCAESPDPSRERMTPIQRKQALPALSAVLFRPPQLEPLRRLLGPAHPPRPQSGTQTPQSAGPGFQTP